MKNGGAIKQNGGKSLPLEENGDGTEGDYDVPSETFAYRTAKERFSRSGPGQSKQLISDR
jgi:hypothetical protein